MLWISLWVHEHPAQVQAHVEEFEDASQLVRIWEVEGRTKQLGALFLCFFLFKAAGLSPQPTITNRLFQRAGTHSYTLRESPPAKLRDVFLYI